MKLNEIANVVQHPAMARFAEYDRLLKGDEKDMDDVVSFIMDDKNSTERRLQMLKKLDEIMGIPQETYTAADLEEFMRDPEKDVFN